MKLALATEAITKAAWRDPHALQMREAAEALAAEIIRICDHSHMEPTGVSIHDPETDVLRSDDTFDITEHGRARRLRLRIARGYFDGAPGPEAA